MNSIAYLKFRKNGKLETRDFYKNGYRNGLHKNYYDTGVLCSSGMFLEGSKEGIWKYYYESGFLSSVCIYKKGKKEGLREKFYPGHEPEIMIRENYLDGKRHGLWTKYYPSMDDGYEMVKGYYIKGKMEGFWSRFDENGTLRETENYLSGNKNGRFKYYNKDGCLIKERLFR